MPARLLKLLMGVVAALAVAGCTVPQGPLRIGAKDFEEQVILAHMLATLARDQGMRATLVECGDTYGCQQAMRGGEVDVMVEYSGTASVLGGVAGDDVSAKEIYRSLGLRWLADLGFDNAYVAVVPTARAAALDMQSIGDLAQLADGVRVATPSVYARRPGDGLFPLLRRYGLRLDGRPLLIDNPGERFQALLNGRADVAIAYGTDGALKGRRLRALEDPLDFFPAYRAAVVARREAVGSHPALEGVAERLAGRLDRATMRDLNARVQLEGQDPAMVAADFLRKQGMVTGPGPAGGEAELSVVTHPADRLGAETSHALRAVRQAFPQRSVRTREHPDPIDALANGSARLAVVGGERFFHSGAGGFRRDQRAEAVAVLDTRMLHLVRTDGRHDLAGEIGVLGNGSGAARVGSAILELLDKQATVRAGPAELLRRVAEGSLDGALVLAEVPDPEIAEALAEHGNLRVVPFGGGTHKLLSNRVPYLRAARLPPQSYPGQAEAVDTLGTQVVIAGPAPGAAGDARVGGPAAALRTAGVPLVKEEVDALVEATGGGELPDPVLPSPWSLRSAEGRGGGESMQAVVDTTLNVGVWLFLGWLVLLLIGRVRGGQP
jgi:osmoprotectant transport system substrate-binding protein